MALTFPRWAAIFLAGALVIVVAIWRETPPDDVNRMPPPTTETRRSIAQRHLSDAANRLRILQLRDSVRRSLGTPADSRSRLVIGGSLTAERPVLERAAELVPQPSQGGVPVDVAIVSDSGSLIAGINSNKGSRMSPAYVLPDSRSARCMVIVRYSSFGATTADRRLFARRLFAEYRRDRMVGPCAYYAAFGHPGPQIRQWLERHDWSIGIVGDWSAAPDPWQDDAGPPRLLLAFDPQFDWRFRAITSPEHLRCTAGDVDECERLIAEGLPPRRSLHEFSVNWGQIVDPSGNRPAYWRMMYTPFGPREDWVLAEMVRTLGPERFRKFWTSNAGPAEAFRSATGTTLGDWTREWSERTYGPQVRGPGVPLSVIGWSLLVAGLALAFAMATARGRVVR